VVEVEQDGDDEGRDQGARYVHPRHPAHVLQGAHAATYQHTLRKSQTAAGCEAWPLDRSVPVIRLVVGAATATRCCFQPAPQAVVRMLQGWHIAAEGAGGGPAALTPATVQVVVTSQVLGICTRRGRPPGEGLAIAYARPLHATTISGTP
jgi:hypothetical protein